MPKAYSNNRAKIVTDQSSKTPAITTSVMRDQYEEFERRAHAEGLTKSAKLRQLIEDYLRTR